MNHNTLYPIVFFAYNRPKHTLKSLNALKKNKLAAKSIIYVFLDGPKNLIDVENNQEVLKVIKSFTNEFLEMRIFHNQLNMGLSHNIVNGINKIFKEFDALIVLEDDIEVSECFLEYMNESLLKYSLNKKIWHISGYTKPFLYEGNKSRFFWSYMECWGWATWKDRWNNYFKDPEYLIKKFSPVMKYRFNFYDLFPEWEQVLLNKHNKLDTWAVFWHATIFLNNGLCMNPVKSLTRNIGFDNSGKNCGKNDFLVKQYISNSIDNIYPKSLEEDKEIISKIKSSFVKRNYFISKVKFYVKNFFPMGAKITNFIKLFFSLIKFNRNL